MTIGERIDHAKDKIGGKKDQLVGEARGDEKQKARGHVREIKSDLGEAATDIKESFKDR